MRFSAIVTAAGHRWLAVILALTTAISLTGCNPQQFKTSAAQVPQLVVSVSSDPKTFNYILSQESPNVFGLTFKGLTTINGAGEIKPELAESWAFSDDKQRIVFTLREKLKWSDGQPLTADDVIFTYEELVFNKQIPNQFKDYLKIGSSGAYPKLRKIDDRRIEFILPEPFAPFLRTTAAPTDAVAILPKHILYESVTSKDSNGKPQFLSTWATDTNPAKIIVNGPYQIESYTPSERVVFRRNPYYWRKDAQGNPQPYIERYIWQLVENTDTSLLQFRSGVLDIVSASSTNFSLLKREEKRGNFTIYNGGPAFGTRFISFNLNKAKRNGRPLVDPIKSRWFNTVAFRQAVAHAIDRQTMINNLLRGLGKPQNSPIDVQTPYYLSPKEGLKVYDYNPARAKELLLGAGFKYNDNNQLLDADGNQVRFTLLSSAGSATADAMGSQIKQDLSKIGIQADFQPLAFNALTDKLSNTLDWECYLGALSGAVEPNQGANVWLPEGNLHTFNQALAGIEDREVADWEQEIGRLYIKGAQEFNEAKRKAIYAETQRISQEYLPYIYLINPLSMTAIRNRVKGIKYSALEGAFWNIYELKVTEK
ncbi:MAG: ABC transporter substrate-binding protein [Aphanothece sp. CMT-3BRIN-NPC111]|nr:ABC transporter substrate-binding protein [Aphanothece sp. CMT-3BRIN-NPC111]